jgi:hypothetical protein
MRAHPEVHAPPVKEVHYFDARFVPKWCAKYEAEMLADFQQEAAALSLETCADPARQQKLMALLLRFRMIASPADYMRFMSWGAGARRVLFEATPDYSMLGRDGFAAMRSVHADARLIFLLRNPADRFWSVLRFNRTHNPSFDIDVMFDRLLRREDFLLLADYGRTIRAARDAFGEERLHVEFFARLFSKEAVERICDFAGIQRVAANLTARRNASTAIEMPRDKRLEAISAYIDVYRDVASLFGNDLPESWLEDMDLYERGAVTH